MICVGDDWAQNHHDVELVGRGGRRLTRVRLPEGVEGITRLHALIARHLVPLEYSVWLRCLGVFVDESTEDRSSLYSRGG
jgi:hypothetical protein